MIFKNSLIFILPTALNYSEISRKVACFLCPSVRVRDFGCHVKFGRANTFLFNKKIEVERKKSIIVDGLMDMEK